MTQTHRIGIFGASGSGKTTKAKALLANAKRLVVLDPMEEWGGTKCATIPQATKAMRAGWGKGFRVSVVPRAGHEMDTLDALARLILRAQGPYRAGQDGRTITLVVDELNLSFPHGIPRELMGFGELCSRGRHYGVNLVGVSQRLAEVNTRFRGNMTAAYFFRPADTVDVDNAAQLIGREYKSDLRALPDHHGFYLCGGKVARIANPPPKKSTKSRKR